MTRDTEGSLVTRHTVYSAVVGSRAYGLAGPDSDTDRRGVYAAPAPLFWRLDKPPTHLDGPLPEQFSWELERCCLLALAANPTVLECLWSPLVERTTDVGDALLALRPAFLSRRVGETYGNYAADQFARLDAGRHRTGAVNWKQAMHMLRLLMAGAHVLRTGEVLVDVSAHRVPLLAVKHGERDWAEVAAWADALRADLAGAAAGTALPPLPDRAGVEAFLISVRRASVDP
jgi:predicted nucleotidyltransferase